MNQLCGGCGAELTTNPDAIITDCVCGYRLIGGPTPPVEDLNNLCRSCTHQLNPSHDDFGCHQPDCACTVTAADGAARIAATLANSAPMSRIIKRAWVRDQATPPGAPALGQISCPCGQAPPSMYGDGKDVNCACGRIYDSTGNIKRDLENVKPTEEDWTEGRVKCSRPGCKEEAHGSIAGKPVCDKHADAKQNSDEREMGWQLAKKLGVKAPKDLPFDQPNPHGCNGCDDIKAKLNIDGYCLDCAKQQGEFQNTRREDKAEYDKVWAEMERLTAKMHAIEERTGEFVHLRERPDKQPPEYKAMLARITELEAREQALRTERVNAGDVRTHGGQKCPKPLEPIQWDGQWQKLGVNQPLAMKGICACGQRVLKYHDDPHAENTNAATCSKCQKSIGESEGLTCSGCRARFCVQCVDYDTSNKSLPPFKCSACKTNQNAAETAPCSGCKKPIDKNILSRNNLCPDCAAKWVKGNLNAVPDFQAAIAAFEAHCKTCAQCGPVRNAPAGSPEADAKNLCATGSQLLVADLENASAEKTGAPSGFRCPKCGSELEWGGQHNGKPTTWCAKCNQSYGVAQVEKTNADKPKPSKSYAPGTKGSSSGYRARVKEMYSEGMITLWLPGGTATVPVEDFIPGDAAYAAADAAGRSAFENAGEDACNRCTHPKNDHRGGIDTCKTCAGEGKKCPMFIPKEHENGMASCCQCGKAFEAGKESFQQGRPDGAVCPECKEKKNAKRAAFHFQTEAESQKEEAAWAAKGFKITKPTHAYGTVFQFEYETKENTNLIGEPPCSASTAGNPCRPEPGPQSPCVYCGKKRENSNSKPKYEIWQEPDTSGNHIGGDAVGAPQFEVRDERDQTVFEAKTEAEARAWALAHGELKNAISSSQWDELAREYAKFDTIPMDKADQLLAIIHSSDDAGILELAAKDIKFVSKVARNEAFRRGLKNAKDGQSACPRSYSEEHVFMPVAGDENAQKCDLCGKTRTKVVGTLGKWIENANARPMTGKCICGHEAARHAEAKVTNGDTPCADCRCAHFKDANDGPRQIGGIGLSNSGEFTEALKKVAEANGKTEAEIRALWDKYAKSCEGFDQSPVFPEFLQWNNLKGREFEFGNDIGHASGASKEAVGAASYGSRA